MMCSVSFHMRSTNSKSARHKKGDRLVYSGYGMACIRPHLKLHAISYVFYASCTVKANSNAQCQNEANRSRPRLHDAEIAAIEAQFAQAVRLETWGGKEPQQLLKVELSHAALVRGRCHVSVPRYELVCCDSFPSRADMYLDNIYAASVLSKDMAAAWNMECAERACKICRIPFGAGRRLSALVTASADKRQHTGMPGCHQQ